MDKLYLTLLITFVSRTDKIFPDTTMVVIVDSLSKKNIQGEEGYTVTMYNLDGGHPLWKNNVQMASKRMKIVNVEGNIVELRGYGYDENALAIGAPLQAASFENYGVVVMIEDDSIVRAQLNMFDRNISIVYLQ